jgi:hypothetical protein
MIFDPNDFDFSKPVSAEEQSARWQRIWQTIREDLIRTIHEIARLPTTAEVLELQGTADAFGFLDWVEFPGGHFGEHNDVMDEFERNKL